MGKRKSKAKPPPKKRMDKLDTVFSCPFCNHGSSVECRIDMKNLIGEALCRICQENFSMTVTDIVNGSMNVNGSTMLKMMLLRRVVQTFRCSGFDVMGKTKNKCSSLRQTLMYINARLISVSISASLRLFMVAEMESILQEHNAQMPTRELLEALAEKFRHVVSAINSNRRYAIRAKTAKAPGKLSISPMPREDSSVVRNVSQAPQSAKVPSAVQSAGRTVSDNSQMEFEAKSARDGAWYDVAMFLSHRSLETGEPDVKVRFAGFGPEEDEWVNVRKHVRQRSLPCESSECVAVLPGDLILCFQEGKEQALYFDAHVLDAQRRRHDVRGCRCRFLVRYDHDQSEFKVIMFMNFMFANAMPILFLIFVVQEIVPLRKVCRRPETDYRLQQLHAVNDSGSVNQQKKTSGPHTANSLRVYPPTETTQKQPKVEVVAPAPQANATVSAETKVLPPKSSEISTASNVGTPIAPPPNVALTSGAATSTITSDSGQNTPQG
ncbi:hypothetical protein RHGRI_018370 [Rhododendron griersonianum]|uniref:SAWADEE domain-containing protein n=1 Tax=Rhododendron griersonianum TaxID=479676 RepID=A0AAV6K185_9ERIC|nr:hypothetical protein RHGRI_018370 [Rhododendron griersonianum]